MPEQSVHEARGLTQLAIKAAQQQPTIHPGVQGHLKAAQTQLDAACALLAKKHA